MKSTGLVFFWDYDTQWGSDRGSFEFPSTDRLLDLHAKYNVPACFAVVGASALPGERPYHDPKQIRRIHAAGHEIASHSFRHEWLPALDRRALLETLRTSKEALEQCVGAPIISFVPPYNRPFDYSRGWSFSISERRKAGRKRTDLRQLCEALGETGYRFCRVAYQPMHLRLAEKILRRSLDRPLPLERIEGITCARLNTPCGFAAPTIAMLKRYASSDGLLIVYGHPHSLQSGNSQDEIWLVPFLQEVERLCRRGLIRVYLPRELLR